MKVGKVEYSPDFESKLQRDIKTLTAAPDAIRQRQRAIAAAEKKVVRAAAILRFTEPDEEGFGSAELTLMHKAVDKLIALGWEPGK